MMAIRILDDDCLLHIFEYLPLNEIMKLEETSEIFSEPAQIYYRTIKSFECNYRYTPLEDLYPILTRIGQYLKCFKFSGGYIMRKEYKSVLFNVLSEYCRNLKELSLNYVPIELNSIIALSKISEHLVILDLGNCHYEDEGLTNLFSHTKHLKNLKFNGNSLLTGACLKHLKTLEVLDVSYCFSLNTKELCDFLKNSVKLKVLNISGSYMLDWKKILYILNEYQDELEELNMTNLGIQESDIAYQNFKHLKVFDITGDRLCL